MVQFIQLYTNHLQNSWALFLFIVHHKKSFRLMQHKLVCKILLTGFYEGTSLYFVITILSSVRSALVFVLLLFKVLHVLYSILFLLAIIRNDSRHTRFGAKRSAALKLKYFLPTQCLLVAEILYSFLPT